MKASKKLKLCFGSILVMFYFFFGSISYSQEANKKFNQHLLKKKVPSVVKGLIKEIRKAKIKHPVNKADKKYNRLMVDLEGQFNLIQNYSKFNRDLSRLLKIVYVHNIFGLTPDIQEDLNDKVWEFYQKYDLVKNERSAQSPLTSKQIENLIKEISKKANKVPEKKKESIKDMGYEIYVYLNLDWKGEEFLEKYKSNADLYALLLAVENYEENEEYEFYEIYKKGSAKREFYIKGYKYGMYASITQEKFFWEEEKEGVRVYPSTKREFGEFFNIDVYVLSLKEIKEAYAQGFRAAQKNNLVFFFASNNLNPKEKNPFSPKDKRYKAFEIYKKEWSYFLDAYRKGKALLGIKTLAAKSAKNKNGVSWSEELSQLKYFAKVLNISEKKMWKIYQRTWSKMLAFYTVKKNYQSILENSYKMYVALKDKSVGPDFLESGMDMVMDDYQYTSRGKKRSREKRNYLLHLRAKRQYENRYNRTPPYKGYYRHRATLYLRYANYFVNSLLIKAYEEEDRMVKPAIAFHNGGNWAFDYVHYLELVRKFVKGFASGNLKKPFYHKSPLSHGLVKMVFNTAEVTLLSTAVVVDAIIYPFTYGYNLVNGEAEKTRFFNLSSSFFDFTMTTFKHHSVFRGCKHGGNIFLDALHNTIQVGVPLLSTALIGYTGYGLFTAARLGTAGIIKTKGDLVRAVLAGTTKEGGKTVVRKITLYNFGGVFLRENIIAGLFAVSPELVKSYLDGRAPRAGRITKDWATFLGMAYLFRGGHTALRNINKTTVNGAMGLVLTHVVDSAYNDMRVYLALSDKLKGEAKIELRDKMIDSLTHVGFLASMVAGAGTIKITKSFSNVLKRLKNYYRKKNKGNDSSAEFNKNKFDELLNNGQLKEAKKLIKEYSKEVDTTDTVYKTEIAYYQVKVRETAQEQLATTIDNFLSKNQLARAKWYLRAVRFRKNLGLIARMLKLRRADDKYLYEKSFINEQIVKIQYKELERLLVSKLLNAKDPKNILQTLLKIHKKNSDNVVGVINHEMVLVQKGTDCVLQAIYHNPLLRPLFSELGMSYKKFVQTVQNGFSNSNIGVHADKGGRGLFHHEIITLLKTMGFEKAKVRSRNSIKEQDLLKLMEEQGTIIADLTYRKGSGHAVVIEAAFKKNGRWHFIVRDSLKIDTNNTRGLCQYTFKELHSLLNVVFEYSYSKPLNLKGKMTKLIANPVKEIKKTGTTKSSTKNGMKEVAGNNEPVFLERIGVLKGNKNAIKFVGPSDDRKALFIKMTEALGAEKPGTRFEGEMGLRLIKDVFYKKPEKLKDFNRKHETRNDYDLEVDIETEKFIIEVTLKRGGTADNPKGKFPQLNRFVKNKEGVNPQEKKVIFFAPNYVGSDYWTNVGGEMKKIRDLGVKIFTLQSKGLSDTQAGRLELYKQFIEFLAREEGIP